MTLTEPALAMATSPNIATLPVVIIGAGPIGLAAAAHLVERGKDFLLLESGESVASSVAAWGHIRLFSGWSELIDPAARRLLESRGWAAPDAAVAPFAHELISDYLAPLAAVEQIASRTVTGTTVLAVSRLGMDRTRSTGRDERPFVARIAADGQISEVHARAVIDASGTFTRPNHLGSNGLDPLGLDDVKHLVSSALPDVLGADRLTFEGVHTVVVGAGHSAANTLLALAGLDDETRITWLLRNTSAARVTAAVDDGLPGRASLGARVDALVTAGRITVVDAFEVVRLEASGTGLDIFGYRQGKLERLTADRVVNATGFRPDLDMLREIRLDLDEVVEAPRLLAPLIDPNVHSCGTVEPHGYVELRHPESGFFIVGMKSYGRAPTFLLATGYEQVRSITAWLDNDTASARAVQLTLPATGVCSTDSGCCS